ncbi:uncharacterized protein (DUF305 family) [Zhihengliuella halotolerans]|uniref:Uncharacterized protein (DUF305 family) n=1 Tax=Zhihengliuella halotolerans TaxID=370736 RepID=A0A4Q8AE63_9MICC|nr:uncharacterized protein (DUF305 family) [Zhihengliuella halotolerans]
MNDKSPSQGATFKQSTRRRSGRGRSLAAALTAAVLTLALTSCVAAGAVPGDSQGKKKPEPTATSSAPAVVVPGAPGGGNETGAPGTGDPDTGESWNEADAEFMAMMIPHHAQAVAMTDMVPGQAASEELKNLARRMNLEQGAEIQYMVDWLSSRDVNVPAEAEDGWAPGGMHMHGMLSDEEMAALAEADGEEFDRLFLEGMIKHHEGAIVMCDSVQIQGIDDTVQEMSTHMSSSQSAEIGRMRDLLGAL